MKQQCPDFDIKRVCGFNKLGELTAELRVCQGLRKLFARPGFFLTWILFTAALIGPALTALATSRFTLSATLAAAALIRPALTALATSRFTLSATLAAAALIGPALTALASSRFTLSAGLAGALTFRLISHWIVLPSISSQSNGHQLPEFLSEPAPLLAAPGEKDGASPLYKIRRR
jgi:hypothetical protein